MVLIWPHYLTIFYGFASSRNVETAIFLADVVSVRSDPLPAEVLTCAVFSSDTDRSAPAGCEVG